MQGGRVDSPDEMGGTGGGRGAPLLATHLPPVGAAACRLHDVLLPLLQRAIRWIQSGTGCEAVYNIGINVLHYSVGDPGCFSQIPDSNFFHPGSQIRIFHPRSRISIKELNYFNPKIVFSLSNNGPGCSSRIRILILAHPGRFFWCCKKGTHHKPVWDSPLHPGLF